MSVATQIERINTDKATIRSKLVELGLASSGANLDALAEAVDGIVDCGSVSAQVKEGETYTVPKGYHDGTGTVSGVAGGGSYSLQSKSVTPTKSQQEVTPDEGYYGLSDVKVAAIPEAYQDVSSVTATAQDILSGKIAVGPDGSQIAGTMANNGSVSRKLDASTTSYTIAKGYHDGTGSVSVTVEKKSATPTKGQQVISPTEGSLLSQVTVEAIPANYVDTSDATAAAPDVLSGKTAYADGSKVTGTMPNNGAVTAEIDGMSTTSYEVPAGYTTGGTVSLTDDIETALAAI